MATMQGMNAVDLVAVTAELSDMLPCWVHKIYQSDAKTIYIRLNTANKEKINLLIDPGKRMHQIAELPSLPKLPPQYAMFLRKYVNGGRVTAISQYGLQRTISIDIQKSEQLFHLIIELFDEGNVILCAEDYTIIHPLVRHRFKDRSVLPGVVYQFFSPDVSQITREEFAAQLAQDDRDVVRALAIGSYLGGMYAEYICTLTQIPKETAAADADANQIYDAIHTLLTTVKTKRTPIITDKGCNPIDMGIQIQSGPYNTYWQALEAFYPAAIPKTKSEKRPFISREDRIRAQQEGAIKKFERKIAENERKLELIYENYQLVSDVIATLHTVSKQRSWQEIEQILQSDTTGPGSKIKTVFADKAAVELDLGLPVFLYVHETLEANCTHYYEEIKKYKRKIQGAKTAMEKVQPQKPRKVSQFVRPKKKWYHRFRWFYTSDNTLVVGGKDAGQNEELVKKYLEGKDTFVHADVFGASVVIVKGQTENWDEVSTFAASYSGAWRSGHFFVDVYAARPDQVSKTTESGEYVSRGSFIVRGERQWFKEVPLHVMIGLQIKPSTQIIGGPQKAISQRVEYAITLIPGMYEPNDVAKKAVKILREKVPPADAAALKFALHAEAIAAFVPPGGSDFEKTEG
ncbi:MAG: NFACT family protein [Methanomicrobiales archaeon]|jgi:predicted ribosome quality control (RQC) complex YloA/Tae2 family protein|nr:NFACT family protein [Methanomicrobiales archaeon]